MAVRNVELIKHTINRHKKAKINWLLTVTQLSFEQLEIIVKELGFVFKGEYVVLPSEAEHIRAPKTYTPLPTFQYTLPPPRIKRRLPQRSKMEYRFCINCGSPLKDSGSAEYLSGFCPNCGSDLEEIFVMRKEMNPYKKKRCSDCGLINPEAALYCFYCGSEKLSSLI